MLTGYSQCLRTVVRLDYLVAVHCKDMTDEAPSPFVIIDHQDRATFGLLLGHTVYLMITAALEQKECLCRPTGNANVDENTS
jgi:hypothetical protein